MQPTPPLPPRLRLLNAATLLQLAYTIESCVRAIRDGGRVRGMDPLIMLNTLAQLLRDAAERER